MRRWLVRIGIGAVVLVAVLIVAAKLLLRTGFAADKVAAQLQEAAGTPVHVGSLDVGIRGSSLYNLQFFEEGAPPETTPWAEIAEVDADVSLPQLIRGDFADGDITLRHAKLTFRFDRDDKLLTKLPSSEGPSRAWPVFHIADGQITFQREGSPDAVFTGINGTLQKTGDHIALNGAANDPTWGAWTIAGDRADAAAPFKLTLHTDAVRATPEKLRRVPFVPPVTWEQVSLDGNTSVDLALQFGGSQNGPAVRYRVALAPTDTTVHVSSIDLTAHGVSGKVLVEDGLVTLADVNGNTAGGTLHLPKSVLDFRGEGSEQQYTVAAERLKLRELPKKWGLPGWDGRLSGRADVTVSTRNGQVQTKGGGSGVIEGFLSQKIEVKLTANDRGFKFDISNAPGADLAPKGRQSVARGASPWIGTATKTLSPGGAVVPFNAEALPSLRDSSHLGAGFQGLTPLATDCRPSGADAKWHPIFQGLAPLATDCRPSGADAGGDGFQDPYARLLAFGFAAVQTRAPPASSAAKTIRINIGLTDVSVAELVQKLKLNLPVHPDGRATLHIEATIPLNDPKDLKAYEATGTVALSWARIDDLWLQQVKSRVTLKDGVLRLDDLSAHVPNPPPAAPPTQLLPGGTIDGSISADITSAGETAANLKVANLPLGPLLRLIAGADATAAGTVEGEVQVRAPAADLKDIQKWQGSGKFSGHGLRVQNITADRFEGTIVLRGGSADYSIKGETLGGTFDINGRYPSPPDNKPGAVGRIQIHSIDLARLGDALRIDVLKPLAGRFDLDAHIASVNDPTGTGQVTLTALTWGGKPITDRLGGAVAVGDGAIRINEFGGPLAGGSVRLRMNYDFRHPGRNTASLRAERVDGRTLLAPFTETPHLDGPLDIRLYTRLGGECIGTGEVMLGYGTLFGISVRDAHFPLGWDIAPGHRGELRLHDAAVQASRGRLTGRANLLWGEAARLDGQIQFTTVDIAQLLSHYSQTKVVSGLASGRVDLGGQNMHSVNDLTARVNAKLAQASPGQMPIFEQIMPMILPSVGSNVQFQSGDLRGQLSRGVFRIERLALVGDMARIHAEGTVTLQERLNLNVVANTKQLGVDPAALQLIGMSLPAIGPIPLGAMNQAVSYLSNQTISLRVTGTVKAPSVQVNPVPLLTESAVRFFVMQAGVPLPSAALQAPEP